MKNYFYNTNNLIITFVLILLCLFSGCNVEKNIAKLSSDTMPDFQYMFKYTGVNTPTQKSDSGYYNVVNKNIIYTDSATMKSIPLCNKSDCLHTGEYSECNAKIRDWLPCLDNFQIYKGNIYYMAMDFSGNSSKADYSYLKRISLDGSEREINLTVEEYVRDWFIYKDYLYYQTNITVRENYSDAGSLYRVNLSSKSEPEEFINFSKFPNIFGASASFRNIYDGYLYVTLSGFTSKKAYETVVDGGEITDDSDARREIVRYSLADGSYMIINPDGNDYEFEGFYGDKLFGYATESDDKTNYVCISDLDGKNSQRIFDFKIGNRVYCDDKYFYLYNHFSIFEDPEKNVQKTIKTYDVNGEKIAEVNVPDEIKESLQDATFGDEYVWFVLVENEKTSVCVIDKKELLRNGEELRYEKVYTYE